MFITPPPPARYGCYVLTSTPSAKGHAGYWEEARISVNVRERRCFACYQAMEATTGEFAAFKASAAKQLHDAVAASTSATETEKWRFVSTLGSHAHTPPPPLVLAVGIEDDTCLFCKID